MSDKHLQTIGQGLILIAFMLAVIAAALWLRPASVESTASARAVEANVEPKGIPDAGLQRLDMVTELRVLNDHVDRIEKGLRGGEFQIQIIEPKAPAGAVKAEK